MLTAFLVIFSRLFQPVEQLVGGWVSFLKHCESCWWFRNLASQFKLVPVVYRLSSFLTFQFFFWPSQVVSRISKASKVPLCCIVHVQWNNLRSHEVSFWDLWAKGWIRLFGLHSGKPKRYLRMDHEWRCSWTFEHAGGISDIVMLV